MPAAPPSGREGPLVPDIREIRRPAREHMEEGAVTPANPTDPAAQVRLPNEVLATEIVCALRYQRHQFMAAGLHAPGIAEEFAQHAQEEQGHADLIAERITQPDGEPNFSPEDLATRSHTEYVEGRTVVEMIREDLVAERIAIESYPEIVRCLANRDPTSRALMEKVLAMDEEHAEEMRTLLEQVGADERVSRARG